MSGEAPLIVGFSDSVHDRSACLFRGNQPLVAIEEERLTRIKHGLEMFAETRRDPALFAKLKLEDSPADRNERRLRGAIDYCLKAGSVAEDQVDFMIGNSLHKYLPFRGRALFINHHLAHAASAFYGSGFDDAAILVMDGYGDAVAPGRYETILIADGTGNGLTVKATVSGRTSTYYDMENSLGVFYRIGTLLSGFGLFDEGKTMGLSGYGEPLFHDVLSRHIRYEHDRVVIDNKQLWQTLSRELRPPGTFEHRANIASSFQKHLEEIVVFYADLSARLTGKRRLCIAGGVSLNCVSNAKLLRSGAFEDVFVFPAAGDNGISMGAAYYVAHAVLGLPRSPQLPTAYLGSPYSEGQCLQALRQTGGAVTYTDLDEPERCRLAVDLLCQREVIMWFQEGSEIGPRALGHRSILANPDRAETRDYINAKIKFREDFRPLAPIVLEDHASTFFNIERPSPYMLFSPPVREITRRVAPAIVHVDGTARLQTINASQNSVLYEVIRLFGQRTGTPMILNTSFNGKDEPIVETPAEAVRTFVSSPVRHLFLGQFHVTK